MAKKDVATVLGGSQVEKVQAVINGVLPELPEALAKNVNLRGWLTSLLTGVDYTEPEPGYLQREMALAVLLNPDSIMAQDIEGLPHLQELVGSHAGASTGPIRITDLYIVPSSIEEGAPCYMILTWVSHEDSIVTRCSGGSHAVQIKIARYLMSGVFPIDCEIVRTSTKVKGGQFMLDVWPIG